MDKFYNLSDMAREIILPIKQFNQSKLYYSIILVDEGELFQSLLLKKEEKDQYLLVGFDPILKEIKSIDKKMAIKALNLLYRRACSEYNVEKFSYKDIEKAITELEQSHFKIPPKKDIIHYKINKQFSVLLSNSYSPVEVSITTFHKQGYSLVPNSLSYTSHNQILDYGELNFKDLSKLEISKYINLLDDTILDIQINGKSHKYAGENYELSKNSEGTMLIFSSSFFSMSNLKLGKIKADNISLHNVISPILRPAGLNKGQINIEGHTESFLPHILLFPVKNLLIDGKFGIGNVNFYSFNENFPELEEAKRISKEDFGSFAAETYATVPLMATDFHEAYTTGISIVNIALDAISHLSKQDNLINDVNGNKNNQWKRKDIYSKTHLSSYFYVENLITNEKMVQEINSFYHPVELTIDQNFLNKLSDYEWYEEIISLHMDNQEETPLNLFMALKWLKRSWDSENIEDQIIYTIISLEFILGSEKLESNISKQDRKEIANKGVEVFKERHGEVSLEEEGKLKSKIISSLASVPLLAKLRNMISRLNIPTDEEDFKKVHKIREARNKLVHGKAINDIEQTDIWKVNTIIGKMIFYKLKVQG